MESIKDFFNLNKSMGRLSYFLFIIAASIIWAGVYYLVVAVQKYLESIFGIFLLFVFLLGMVFVVVNFVVTVKMVMDIIEKKLLAIIISIGIMVISFLFRNITPFIFLSLCVIRGQTSKHRKDVIKISDILEDENLKKL